MDTISDDEKAALAFFVKKAEMSQAAVNALADHLCQKYDIKPPDQLVADGRILRATRADG